MKLGGVKIRLLWGDAACPRPAFRIDTLVGLARPAFRIDTLVGLAELRLALNRRNINMRNAELRQALDACFVLSGCVTNVVSRS